MRCLNCKKRFDLEKGHLCPKGRWMPVPEDGNKILEDSDEGEDQEGYEFITSYNKQLREADRTEIFTNISDPSADSSLKKKVASVVHEQIDSSQDSVSEKSYTYDTPTVSDIHAVPGPSRLPFNENEESSSEEEFISKKYHTVHSNVKGWTCNVCQKVYKLNNCYRKHMLKTHTTIHTGVKAFLCDVCGMRFRRNYHLKNHLLIHKGEKPYGCDICDKSYRHKNSLTMHRMSHTGEKPFTCDVCKRGFKQKSDTFE